MVCPPWLKKWGGHVPPPRPPPNCAHGDDQSGADLGGGEGAAAALSSGNHSEKGKILLLANCKITNILLSQNAGNAISETLDVQNFPGGCPDPPSRVRAG